MTISIEFKGGTLELRGVEDPSVLPNGCLFDDRTACYRASASAYSEIVMGFVKGGYGYEDRARNYEELGSGLRVHRRPRPFQSEAIEAWNQSGGRGVVVLPTGAGKSHVALMAIDGKRRNTLVVVPTLDLVRQWYDLLRAGFHVPVGVIGGGDYSVEPLTVTTYDSAYIHMEHLGNRFGLIVFDECHHLPGDTYSLSARFCLAPFRLGLTATPERQDGRHQELGGLIGPTVYCRNITEMTGNYLAEYDVEQVSVDLSEDELDAYREARGVYKDFLRSRGIRMSASDGWSQFVIQSSRGVEGRRAMDAYQRQRRIAFAAPSKLEYLEHLLRDHRRDRTIIFTQDNATVYEISTRFLVPAITHQTKVTERSEMLSRFRDGTYNVIATSKVLNEGVDVPEANVAIVMSGSGSVREHVQRLGRVLRKKADGRRAILYELVAGGTSEAYTSRRRREHSAYR
jgi:superfamily II DNA or RNA helicase